MNELWQNDCLIYWLIGSIDWLIDWLVWLIDWFDWLTCFGSCFVHLLMLAVFRGSAILAFWNAKDTSLKYIFKGWKCTFTYLPPAFTSLEETTHISWGGPELGIHRMTSFVMPWLAYVTSDWYKVWTTLGGISPVFCVTRVCFNAPQPSKVMDMSLLIKRVGFFLHKSWLTLFLFNFYHITPDRDWPIRRPVSKPENGICMQIPVSK